jgi:RNA recognition motif-containing protein
VPGTKLFVGNIPYSTTEQDLQSLFEQSGKVESVRIITDLDSGRSKGYAFVEMATPEEADSAVKRLNNFNLNGRPIVVSEARARSEGGGGRPRR